MPDVVINREERNVLYYHATWELSEHAEMLTNPDRMGDGARIEANVLHSITLFLDAIGWQAEPEGDAFTIPVAHRGHVEMFRDRQQEFVNDDERLAERPITRDDLLDGQTVDEYRDYVEKLVATSRKRLALADAVIDRFEPEKVGAA